MIAKSNFCDRIVGMTDVNKKRIMTFMLASVAVVWGFGFVFTKQVLDFITPAMLNICRFSLSAVVMFFLFAKKIVKLTKRQWLNGIFAGIIMASGFGLQSYGINVTSPSNAALLTGLNVVMVPFFAWAFYKKRPPVRSFFAALMAFASISFLSFGGFSKINIGDLMCFLCAVAFAVHYVVLSKITKDADSSALAFVQMLTAAIIYIFIGTVFDLDALKSSSYDNALLFPMFSLCILSTGFAYVVQTNAQKVVPPSNVSLILSCESVLGAIFSVLMGLDAFTWYLAVAAFGVALALFVSESNFKRRKTLSGITPESVAEKPADDIDPDIPLPASENVKGLSDIAYESAAEKTIDSGADKNGENLL